MKAVFASDSDGNFELSEEEFDRLILRLKCFDVVAKDRVREALLRSSFGKSVTSLYLELEHEIQEDEPTMSSSRSIRGFNSADGGRCGDTDPSFMYRCMD